VNVKTPAINHIRDFPDIRADVVLSLQALDRLRSFALDEQVRQLITASL
jgi:hypothetical protein